MNPSNVGESITLERDPARPGCGVSEFSGVIASRSRVFAQVRLANGTFIELDTRTARPSKRCRDLSDPGAFRVRPVDAARLGWGAEADNAKLLPTWRYERPVRILNPADETSTCHRCGHTAAEHHAELPSSCLQGHGPLPDLDGVFCAERMARLEAWFREGCSCRAFTARPEHRIVFSGPMVLAILAERFAPGATPKTVTRRLITHSKKRRYGPHEGEYVSLDPKGVGPSYRFVKRGKTLSQGFPEDLDVTCPFGRPGDLLWVSECFTSHTPGLVAYRADGACGAWMGDGGGGFVWIPHGWLTKYELRATHERAGARKPMEAYGVRWKSPRFMPRSMARILLGQRSARPERLRSITNEDIEREGIKPDGLLSARETFARAWNKLHARDEGARWEDDPWVWRVEFTRERPALVIPAQSEK